MEELNIQSLSFLDTRSSLWRHRKRDWLDAIGSESESRERTLYGSLAMRMPDLYAQSKEERKRLGISFEEYVDKFGENKEKNGSGSTKTMEGVSTFDPVLAELIYTWFTPCHGARVFDCFAGGITKGAVAVAMGHQFSGIELRQDQVEVNLRRAETMRILPRYYCDDARNMLRYIGVASQDLFISCPPYYDLEVYSSLENDASNQKSYEDFMAILNDAFTKAIMCLKKNRFAVVVVGDVRDKNGAYYNFPGDVVRIFQNGGCSFINDLVVVRNDTTANLRAGKYMNGRKMVRVHERVLVFFKGNPKNVRKHFNPLKNYDYAM